MSMLIIFCDSINNWNITMSMLIIFCHEYVDIFCDSINNQNITIEYVNNILLLVC
jgi:hypothetical protein